LRDRNAFIGKPQRLGRNLQSRFGSLTKFPLDTNTRAWPSAAVFHTNQEFKSVSPSQVNPAPCKKGCEADSFLRIPAFIFLGKPPSSGIVPESSSARSSK